MAESPDLEAALRALRAKTQADVALGVSAEVTPAEADNRLVHAAVEIALLSPDASEDGHLTRSRQNWRTEVTEVRRLAGLAAHNLLRLRLLKIRDRES